MQGVLDRLLSAILAFAALAIAGALMHREFVSSGNSTASLESKYISNWREIARLGRTVGDSTAPVTLVEFSDFQCPFCRRFNGTLRRTLDAFPGQVSYVFVHYPLPNHPSALPAARAAECANTHGKFREIADRMFDTQDSLGKKAWSSYALDAGISDTLGFVKCMGDSVATHWSIPELGWETNSGFAEHRRSYSTVGSMARRQPIPS